MEGGRDPHHSTEMMLNRVFQVNRREHSVKKSLGKTWGSHCIFVGLTLHICRALRNLIWLE